MLHQHARSMFALVACFVLATGGPESLLQGNSARAETHVVRLPTGFSHEVAALGLNPTLMLDYRTFLWMGLTPADFAALQASGVQFYEHANPFTLRLGGVSFDPLAGEPSLPTGWREGSTGGWDEPDNRASSAADRANLVADRANWACIGEAVRV